MISAIQSGPKDDSCACAKRNGTAPTICCSSTEKRTTNGHHSTDAKSNGAEKDDESRIESDDDDAGGCNNPNEEIMDLEDMGDYMESSLPAKVKNRSLHFGRMLINRWPLDRSF